MRGLSAQFMHQLQEGFLAGLRQRVIEDQDLDLQIRKNYLNIYYKGNSLLKLTEVGNGRYQVYADRKFWGNLQPVTFLIDQQTTEAFLQSVPYLKENIIRHGKSSLEIEYEQLIIRANNQEARNNSEYFIIDRQYSIPEGRFDLIGLFWARAGRRRYQEVPLCLIEVKFALNTDIRNIHEQLKRYYNALEPRAAGMAKEFGDIFHQKLELGLFNQPAQRIEAMKTLTVSRKPEDIQFILILVDYNWHSTLLALDHLKSLSFANQIKIFPTGFAMWGQNLKNIPQMELHLSQMRRGGWGVRLGVVLQIDTCPAFLYRTL